jgi:hypothetical protein
LTLRLPTLLLVLLCLPSMQAADLGSADEYEIKAAMILNLTRFVEWPAARMGDGNAPFVIGILGHDPFGKDLDKQLAGRSVGGHPVVIQRLVNGVHAETCHILFVTRGERRKLDEIAPVLAKASVLTVGDGDKFASSGSVFGLVLRESRVQLEVNLSAAQRNGLVVSSRLLKLATVIKEGS